MSNKNPKLEKRKANSSFCFFFVRCHTISLKSSSWFFYAWQWSHDHDNKTRETMMLNEARRKVTVMPMKINSCSIFNGAKFLPQFHHKQSFKILLLFFKRFHTKMSNVQQFCRCKILLFYHMFLFGYSVHVKVIKSLLQAKVKRCCVFFSVWWRNRCFCDVLGNVSYVHDVRAASRKMIS